MGQLAQTSDVRPRHQSHGYPDQIRIAVDSPALQQIRTLTPEPLEHTPKRQRDEHSVPIYQPRRTAQQLEIVLKRLLVVLRKILTDRARQEEDYHHRRRNPERPVEVGVTLEYIEEVLARVERGAASGEDLLGVDVEELLVEGDAPEEALRGGGLAAAGAGGQERGVVWLDLCGAGGGVGEAFIALSVVALPRRVKLEQYWSCGMPSCLLGDRYDQGRPGYYFSIAASRSRWAHATLTSASTSTTTS